jgi:hypothetical protein
LQRLLLILFAPLQREEGDNDDDDIYGQWTVCRQLMSALAADFENILHDGKLDSEALSDCCKFMQKATGVTLSRNANLWGNLLYYMIALEGISQAGRDKLDAIFEWICRQAPKQAYMATKHSSSLDSFILELDKCRRLVENPLVAEEKSVFHHNFRTNIKPEGYAELGGVTYYAIRVDKVCQVIKNVTRVEIRPEEVQRAANETSFCVYARGCFYDAMKSGWPITHTHVDDATGVFSTIPLPEDKLTFGMCKQDRCLFIKQDAYHKIVSDCEQQGSTRPDFRGIEIRSANLDYNGGNPYNFYDRVINLDGSLAWFGFRNLYGHAFENFCGIGNMCNIGVGSEMQIHNMFDDLNARGNWPSVQEQLNLTSILEYYNYTHHADPQSLPPALGLNPFGFRNEGGDEPMPQCPVRAQWERDYTTGPSAFDPQSPPPARRHSQELRSGDDAPAANRMAPGSSRTPLSAASSGVNRTPAGATPGSVELSKLTRSTSGRRRKTISFQSSEDPNDPISSPSPARVWLLN